MIEIGAKTNFFVDKSVSETRNENFVNQKKYIKIGNWFCIRFRTLHIIWVQNPIWPHLEEGGWSACRSLEVTRKYEPVKLQDLSA